MVTIELFGIVGELLSINAISEQRNGYVAVLESSMLLTLALGFQMYGRYRVASSSALRTELAALEEAHTHRGFL